MSVNVRGESACGPGGGGVFGRSPLSKSDPCALEQASAKIVVRVRGNLHTVEKTESVQDFGKVSSALI